MILILPPVSSFFKKLGVTTLSISWWVLLGFGFWVFRINLGY